MHGPNHFPGWNPGYVIYKNSAERERMSFAFRFVLSYFPSCKIEGGSMEIGTTRSGTSIEYKPQESIEDFSAFISSLCIEDRFDVYTMLQVLLIKVKRRNKEESDEFIWWNQRFDVVMNHLTGEKVDEQKLPLGLKTSYDLVRFGTKMLHRFWRELE